MELKNKSLNRSAEEIMVYKKQIDELKESNSSDEDEDEKEKLMNVQKAMESDSLKE